jgi:hypothetical protein
MKHWSSIANMISGSSKLTAETKVRKLRELKEANDKPVRKMGSMMIAKISGDVATRIANAKAGGK